ncbi:hypothetical protein HUT06_33330 [Actinomadura sp. NAK00032]|uniref:hypothetical protein n=1 Tax=Actinomadura sp. NAK00032 TaxID=2742128 RepID=UPI00159072DC|nr:hypothetical protein [Actinomadura sp. NAK00032]QKW38286.1 hypothetical protein HUT06_33330 [Actinomadura sp. NAK00032]
MADHVDDGERQEGGGPAEPPRRELRQPPPQPARPAQPPLPESFPERFAPTPSEGSAPLIVGRMPAREAPRAAAQPGRSFVYSDRDARSVELTAPPPRGLMGLRGPRYEWRVEVDTTLRRDTFVASLPSRTELARFELTIEAEWSVTDPVAVVRRGLDDGAAIVRSRLLDVARTVCHRFEIDRIAEVEAAVADQLRTEPRAYEEGIGVRRCYVQVVPDQRTLRRKERFEDARDERRLTSDEVDDLRRSIRTSSDLFLRYLAQDPNRVGSLIADMRQHEQLKEERVIELYNKAVEEKIIRPAQVNEMLERLLGPMTGVLQPEGRTDLFGTRDVPLAPLPEAAAIAGETAREPERPGGPGEPDEDVMPEQLRGRSEDGVESWRPMPWDS